MSEKANRAQLNWILRALMMIDGPCEVAAARTFAMATAIVRICLYRRVRHVLTVLLLLLLSSETQAQQANEDFYGAFEPQKWRSRV